MYTSIITVLRLIRLIIVILFIMSIIYSGKEEAILTSSFNAWILITQLFGQAAIHRNLGKVAWHFVNNLGKAMRCMACPKSACQDHVGLVARVPWAFGALIESERLNVLGDWIILH